jgi:aspartyl protease family protein
MLRPTVLAATLALPAVAAAALLLAGALPAARAADAPLRGAQGSDLLPASVAKAADGHFWADAVVEGAQVRFLVDTGASNVSLTPDDAMRLGIDPAALVYDQPVHTASGESLAAHVRLASVSVGGALIKGVDALVIGRGLPASLLGMSYLGRLSRVEATPDSLLLLP